MLWVEFGRVKKKCSALKSSDAKSNNNPKEKHKSKLLITKKNRWKGKEQGKRSGWKEKIGTNRTAAQSPFFLQKTHTSFFLTEFLFL
jgi:hypothetical protein